MSRTRKNESISPILRALHWLPVQLRVTFKILLFAYQCFHGIAPSYLSDLLVKYEPRRNLRSSQKDLYVVPQISTNFYGKRSLRHAAPDLWNGLPNHVKYADTVKKFKTSLKTYLFKIWISLIIKSHTAAFSFFSSTSIFPSHFSWSA